MDGAIIAAPPSPRPVTALSRPPPRLPSPRAGRCGGSSTRRCESTEHRRAVRAVGLGRPTDPVAAGFGRRKRRFDRRRGATGPWLLELRLTKSTAYDTLRRPGPFSRSNGSESTPGPCRECLALPPTGVPLVRMPRARADLRPSLIRSRAGRRQGLGSPPDSLRRPGRRRRRRAPSPVQSPTAIRRREQPTGRARLGSRLNRRGAPSAPIGLIRAGRPAHTHVTRSSPCA